MADCMTMESYLERINECLKTLSEISSSKALGDGTKQTWACGITAHQLLTDLKNQLSENFLLRAEVARLAKERDAAVEQLRGICWECKHSKPWEGRKEGSRLVSCEHVGDVLATVGKRKCEYWEWRGTEEQP